MLKVTQSKVTRQDVFKRAHMIRVWANGLGHGYTFGDCLKTAWHEARTGETQAWLWLSDAHMIAHLKNELWGARVNFDAAAQTALRARIAELEAKSAPAAELQLAA